MIGIVLPPEKRRVPHKVYVRKFMRERRAQTRAWLTSQRCAVCGSQDRLVVAGPKALPQNATRIWAMALSTILEKIARKELAVFCRAHHMELCNRRNGWRCHGTNAEYSKGCRCELCRKARSDYWREWKEKRVSL